MLLIFFLWLFFARRVLVLSIGGVFGSIGLARVTIDGGCAFLVCGIGNGSMGFLTGDFFLCSGKKGADVVCHGPMCRKIIITGDFAMNCREDVSG